MWLIRDKWTTSVNLLFAVLGELEKHETSVCLELPGTSQRPSTHPGRETEEKTQGSPHLHLHFSSSFSSSFSSISSSSPLPPPLLFAKLFQKPCLLAWFYFSPNLAVFIENHRLDGLANSLPAALETGRSEIKVSATSGCTSATSWFTDGCVCHPGLEKGARESFWVGVVFSMLVALLVGPHHLSKVHQQYPTVIRAQHVDLGWRVVGTAFSKWQVSTFCFSFILL